MHSITKSLNLINSPKYQSSKKAKRRSPTMENFITPLKNSMLFQDIPSDIIAREILPYAQVSDILKGTVLISPNDLVDRIGIVITGKINIMHIFADGTCSLISVLGEHKVLSADLICTRTRISPYHAIAATPAQIIFIPAAVFLMPGKIMESHRLSILSHLLTLISHENMRKEYRLAIMAQKGLRERILVYLTMQANKRRTNTFTIPFSREELASFLCVNRSALSHELSLMQQEGILRFHKNEFTLLTPY